MGLHTSSILHPLPATGRNINLDLMRFLGVLIIMIAHADPPEWLFNLRNFGTPLLIVGSALTYAFIYRNKDIPDKNRFFRKRLKRLILPAWIFLTFFFLLFYVASLLLNKDFPYSAMSIINSYNFYDGIGFVWIFKVYIILALLTPFTLKLSKAEAIKNKPYFGFIFLLYLAYEIFIALFYQHIPEAYRQAVSTTILVVVPYTVIYAYGLRMHTLSKRTLIKVISASLILTIALVSYKYSQTGYFVPTQEFKYPPTIYYLAYAFFCINLIYLFISRKLNITNPHVKNVIVWLSANSLWIYLWHILAYYLWITFINDFNLNTATSIMFLIKSTYLLSFGCLITFLQKHIIALIKPRSRPGMQKALVLLE